MKLVQRQKAVDACFRIPGVPVSTSSDGTPMVPTTPGEGKKPNQKKRCRAERTTSVQQKRVHVAAADVEPDTDNDFA